MNSPIKVDIWSDVQCPWCYIGKRKFEMATSQFDGDVEIEYHSYELAPDTPPDFDGNTVDYLTKRKGMTPEQVQQALSRISSIAAEVGLDYDFDNVHQTNTLKAHELLHYAKSKGQQVAMKERLMKAYFVDGLHIGQIDVLAQLADDIGLDRDDAARVLREGEFTDAVRADEKQASEYDIRGVPFFVIDGRYGLSGAQDPEMFLKALDTVAKERIS